MTKLLLIEGLPGTGKSSLAKSLAENLSLREISHHLILETDEPHPIRFGSGTSEKTAISDFLTSMHRQWTTFIQQLTESQGTTILEGMTFQQQLNYLLWMDRMEDAIHVVAEITQRIAPLSPGLIYLHNQDPHRAMAETMNIRGTEWVDEKVKPVAQSPYARSRNLNYSEALKGLGSDLQAANEHLFEITPFAKIKIDVTERDWTTINAKALSFALGT